MEEALGARSILSELYLCARLRGVLGLVGADRIREADGVEDGLYRGNGVRVLSLYPGDLNDLGSALGYRLQHT